MDKRDEQCALSSWFRHEHLMSTRDGAICFALQLSEQYFNQWTRFGAVSEMLDALTFSVKEDGRKI